MKRRLNLVLFYLMMVSFVLGLVFLICGLLLNNEFVLHIGVFLAIFFVVSFLAYLEETVYSIKKEAKTHG